MLFRQKNHADAVFAGRWQHHALPGHLLTIKRIRQLNQNPCAVAHQLVGADSTTMIQILEDLQALLNDGVGLGALDVCNEAHTAGVMLMAGAIQSVVLQVFYFGRGSHGYPNSQESK